MPRYRRKKTYRKRPYARRPALRKRRYKKRVGTTSRYNKAVTHRVPTLRNIRPQTQRGMNPFPAVFMTRLRFSDQKVITTNGFGTAVSKIYRINSLFDPDLSGVGNQPYQYDQLTGLYKSYRVYACKVVVQFSDPTGDGMVIGFRVRDSSNAVAVSGQNVNYVREMQWTKTDYINDSGSQKRTFSVYVPLYKVFGIQKAQLQVDTQYSASVSVNPTKQAYLEVFAMDTKGAALDVTYSCNLTYYSRMFDFVTQAQS